MPGRGVPAPLVRGTASRVTGVLAKATGAARGGPDHRRTRGLSHGEPPSRTNWKARWLLGHRESVRRLLPRYRRGRPGHPRVPGSRGGPGQACGRPARPCCPRSKVRCRGPLGDGRPPAATDQDQDTSSVCRDPPCRPVHRTVGKRGRQYPLQEGGRWVSHRSGAGTPGAGGPEIPVFHLFPRSVELERQRRNRPKGAGLAPLMEKVDGYFVRMLSLPVLRQPGELW